MFSNRLKYTLQDELCRVKSLELVQSITTVFDVARHDGSYDWTMAGLFEREITQACPLATTSKVVLHLPQTTEYRNQYQLVPFPPQGTYSIGSTQDNIQEIAVYDLKTVLETHPASTPFQISLRWENSRPKSGTICKALTIDRQEECTCYRCIVY